MTIKTKYSLGDKVKIKMDGKAQKEYFFEDELELIN